MREPVHSSESIDELPPYLVPHSQAPIRIVYEDVDLLLVDKPHHLLSVPGRHPLNHDSLIRRLQPRYPPQVHESQIVTLKEEFRGHKTWHRYSDKQIEKLEKWMKFIGERDGIDIRAGLPALIKEKGAAAFEFNEDAYYGKVKGTWTHTNTRKDKFDLFPQQELMDMLVSL